MSKTKIGSTLPVNQEGNVVGSPAAKKDAKPNAAASGTARANASAAMAKTPRYAAAKLTGEPAQVQAGMDAAKKAGYKGLTMTAGKRSPRY